MFAYFLWFHVGKATFSFYIFCLTILICKSFLGTATIQKETNRNSNITARIQKKTNSYGGPSSFCHLSEPGHLSLATVYASCSLHSKQSFQHPSRFPWHLKPSTICTAVFSSCAFPVQASCCASLLVQCPSFHHM